MTTRRQVSQTNPLHFTHLSPSLDARSWVGLLLALLRTPVEWQNRQRPQQSFEEQKEQGPRATGVSDPVRGTPDGLVVLLAAPPDAEADAGGVFVVDKSEKDVVTLQSIL